MSSRLVSTGIKNIAICTAVALSIVACQTETVDRPKIEYKGNAPSARNTLEIPPDLTPISKEKNIALPEAAKVDPSPETSAVLSSSSKVEMRRDGQLRWLVVQADLEEVWPVMVNYWQKDGVSLVTADPNTGVIETDWLKNYADFTSTAESIFQGLLDRITTSGHRDKYKVRIDNGETPGTSEIYVTHYGLEEVDDNLNSKRISDYEWKNAGSDPNLEAEIMRQLMVDLGISEEEATTVVDSQAIGSGRERATLLLDEADPVLVVNYAFDRAWRRMGSTLDRMTILIEGSDREQGVYLVEFTQTEEVEKGFFGRLFSKNIEKKINTFKSQIRLIPKDKTHTLVAIATEEGVHDRSDFAKDTLRQFYEQLK